MQTIAVRVTFRDDGDSLRNGELLNKFTFVDDSIVMDHDGDENIDVICYSKGGGAFYFRTPVDRVESFERVTL